MRNTVAEGLSTLLILAYSAAAQNPSEVGVVPFPHHYPSNQTGMNDPVVTGVAIGIGALSFAAAVGFVAYDRREKIAESFKGCADKIKNCFGSMFRKNPEAESINSSATAVSRNSQQSLI